ncbi:aminotransferase class III-fold pyridoxal phosphate-dependent enzyme [Flavobacterium agricola]|uniref:Aminotransferase class III-fold pyridoxal phosphate-dependent enzyme n=1 Tax=Flavobacterium agricola TaxID=2870839 RepID=A0ABY6LZH9_9FLAO|nr:aminotransferase class III-fold pyridoxal phosphate-dependent enzyme [Flavobacterium agricola]UYW00291.1 aminotransferase class III-fold pyridoxal phosphate-dependent enzyme [Flavobacterium agricola]
MKNLFDVYPVYDIVPVKGEYAKIWDDKGNEYLDFYGGHGVISIGHAHPNYVKAVQNQVAKLGFYSNSIVNPIQEALAEKLAQASGYSEYNLFLCNSGAEANENALKLASFHNKKKKVIAFHKSFHGRTSAAVAATDGPSLVAPLNANHEVVFLALNDAVALEQELAKGDVCCVIIEGIQGVGGLDQGTTEFFQQLRTLTKQYDAVLILDEIQSGYGRSGKFFAHQYHNIEADIISMAKGMGNGFPIGGILIAPTFKASHGLLGTTFGGNHLACAAALSVLETIEAENLMQNVNEMNAYFTEKTKEFSEITAIKGRGLMLGIAFDFDIAALRKKLILEQNIFTGSASQKNLLRILPPLGITKTDIDFFFNGLKKALANLNN